MRYLVGFVFVLALVASPLGVSAQTAGEVSASEPAPEEPALQLKLDDAGVEVTPSPSRTEDGYTLEEMELRVKRAKMGLLAPAALIVAGVPLWVRGTTSDCAYDPFGQFFRERCTRLRTSGTALTVSGAVGMIVGSILVGVRKRDLRWTVNEYTLQEKQKRPSRRRKIALGVTIPILVVGVGLVIGGAVAVSNSFD
jgi:hypothetical protein